jgi:hypothetical protein
VRPMFRTRAESFSSSDPSATASSSTPQTKIEILSNIPPAMFSLLSSGTNESLRLSLVSTLIRSTIVKLNRSSSESGDITSNLLRLKLHHSESASTVSRIIVVLPTLEAQAYPEYESGNFVNTTCGANDYREVVHTCHGQLGETQIIHQCNGTAGMFTSRCPRQSIQPSCSTSARSHYHCSLLNFTATLVTCDCQLMTRDTHRSLSTLSDSGVLEVCDSLSLSLLSLYLSIDLCLSLYRPLR